VQARVDEIAQARRGGQEAGALEAALGRELEGLGQVAQAQQQAAGAAGALTRQKQRLSGVVGLLGGQFGGMINRVGYVVELLLAGSKATLAFGAGLAGLTVGVSAINAVRDALREARAEQERFNQAVTDRKRAERGALDEAVQGLGRFGLQDERGEQALRSLVFALQRDFGYARGAAAGVAPLAVASGLDAGAAARLYELQRMGFAAETPEQVAALWQHVPPELLAEADRRARGVATTEAGRRARGAAQVTAGEDPLERVQAKLAAAGAAISADELRRRVDAALEAQTRLKEMDAAALRLAHKHSAMGLPDMTGPELFERSALSSQLASNNYYLALLRAEERAGVAAPGVGAQPAVEPLEQQRERRSIVHVVNNNVGTLFNVGDRRTSPWNNARLGLSESGDRD